MGSEKGTLAFPHPNGKGTRARPGGRGHTSALLLEPRIPQHIFG